MKQDVTEYVGKCLTCQKVKIENRHVSDLLKQLDILVRKDDDILVDFVTKLSKTFNKNNVIWVVIDCLTTTLTNFLAIFEDYVMNKLA